MVQFSVSGEKTGNPNKGDNTSILEHSWKVFEYDISAAAAANKGGNFRKRGPAPISRGADSELPPPMP